MKGRHDLQHTSRELFLSLANCRFPVATAHCRPRRLLKMLLFLFLVFLVCVVLYIFFFTIGVHWIFVLMHCEARDRFSLPMRSGMCAVDGIAIGWFFVWQGKKTTHIWNICRMHMKNFTRNVSEYWRRRKRLGWWRGSINWGHEFEIN